MKIPIYRNLNSGYSQDNTNLCIRISKALMRLTIEALNTIWIIGIAFTTRDFPDLREIDANV